MLRPGFVVALLLVATLRAMAAEPTHIQAANQYFDAALAVDREQTIKVAVEDMLRNRPDERQFIREYETFMAEVLASPEHRSAKVRVLTQTFSEEELRQLTALVQLPAYKLYIQRFPELSKANRSALLEAVGPKIRQFVEHIESLKSTTAK